MKTKVICGNEDSNFVKFKDVDDGSLFLYKRGLYVKVKITRHDFTYANAITIGEYCEYFIDEDSFVEVLDVEVK